MIIDIDDLMPDDAIIVKRLAKSPSHRVYTVKVGSLGTQKVKDYLENVKKTIASRKST